MSVHRAVTVTCDICGEIHDECGYSTKFYALIHARDDGWKRRIQNGKTIDICDICIDRETGETDEHMV